MDFKLILTIIFGVLAFCLTSLAKGSNSLPKKQIR